MSRAGSIKRDESGRWFFVIDLTAPGAVQRRQVRRRGFRTKAEAQQALDEVKASIYAGAYVEPSRDTFGSYLQAWLDGLPAAGLRPSTIDSYRRKVDAYIAGRPIADVPLQALSPVDLDRLYAELLTAGGRLGARKGKPLSARTVRYVHAIVRKALADAERKSLVPRNAAKLATPPAASAARAPEFTVWTPAELGRFLETVADHHHGAMFRLLAMTGLRRGEACGVRWGDVDLDAAVIRVAKAITMSDGRPVAGDVKTKRSRRTLDLDDTTVATLRAHRRTQLEQRMLVGAGYRGQGLVFAMPDGSPWNPDSISQAFERAVARATLPAIRLHDLRHGHATHLLAAGVNAKVVSERLGHSSVGFTLDTYGHVLPGQQASAAAAVAALVDG